MSRTDNGKRIFLVAGEHSGDFLGAALMRSLAQRLDEPVFAGVGGEHMEEQGMHSLFPLCDIAVMGIADVVARLPLLRRRIGETVRAALAFEPDLVVIVDSPEFTHAVARRIRHHRPGIPVVDYVSPSVWAWRPGRARKMTHYIDHVLALLPFEPEVHRKLGGPPCTYVGHPLVEKLDFIEKCDPARLLEKYGLQTKGPFLVVLPGSRKGEVRRLLPVFGATVKLLRQKYPDLQTLMPVAPMVSDLVEEILQTEQGREAWPVPPLAVIGEEEKFAAFNLADAALAASGTVTLELALCGTPMVVAYRVGLPELALRPLVKVHSIVLANLVLERNLFPEFIQEKCTPENLSAAVDELLRQGVELAEQQKGLAEIKKRMQSKHSTPAARAAEIVCSFL